MAATVTKQRITAAILAIKALADAIRELGSVPSGHLYAQVMGHMDLTSYTKAVETLKRIHMVKEENHLLTWIGPAID